MPDRELIRRIPPTAIQAPCEAQGLARRWGIDLAVASGLIAATWEYISSRPGQLGKNVFIISGYRTPAEQDQLRASGRPTASNECSTHLSCPATGADISLGALQTDADKWMWGLAVERVGMRWGGGSPRDPETKIPSDWQHVDLGPRC